MPITCKNCGSMRCKSWDNLTEDEKFIVKRLQQDKRYSEEKRKKQRFCKRCFYQVDEQNTQNV